MCLGSKLAKCNPRGGRGCISLRAKTTPVLRQAIGASSLVGCTTYLDELELACPLARLGGRYSVLWWRVETGPRGPGARREPAFHIGEPEGD